VISEADFLEEIHIKVLSVFLLAIHGHFPPCYSRSLSSLLFTVTFLLDIHGHLYCFAFAFKLTQPLTVSRVPLLYTVKEKGGKPDRKPRKPYPLPYGLRTPYRYFKFENSQDYDQEPERNCTFMNSVLGHLRSLPARVLGNRRAIEVRSTGDPV
jgi:hypothetical protein